MAQTGEIKKGIGSAFSAGQKNYIQIAAQ